VSLKGRIRTNGKPNEAKDFNKEEINYPVKFDFKAMMDGYIADDLNKQALVDAFAKFDIEYIYHDKKISSKGSYVSFTYTITIVNKNIMRDFYEYLKTVEGLKFAL
jgi:putative lipoic acid-binding regulatory protein